MALIIRNMWARGGKNILDFNFTHFLHVQCTLCSKYIYLIIHKNATFVFFIMP